MHNKANFIYRALQRPLVVKATHTFWQAFLAALLVSGFKLDKTVLLAAVAAGLSALKTLVLASAAGRKA